MAGTYACRRRVESARPGNDVIVLGDFFAARSEDVVAERWAATDELAEWWPRDDVRKLVRELSHLARDACSSDRQLWYWWSL